MATKDAEKEKASQATPIDTYRYSSLLTRNDYRYESRRVHWFESRSHNHERIYCCTVAEIEGFRAPAMTYIILVAAWLK